MFVHTNFDGATPPPEPVHENRALGLLVLLICLALCLLFSLGVDASVLVPFNATKAVTQTWQAQHPQTKTPTIAPTSTPRRFRPTVTPAPLNPIQQADINDAPQD